MLHVCVIFKGHVTHSERLDIRALAELQVGFDDTSLLLPPGYDLSVIRSCVRSRMTQLKHISSVGFLSGYMQCSFWPLGTGSGGNYYDLNSSSF